MARTTRTRFWRTVPGVAALAALALTACVPDDDAAEFEDSEPAAQTQATGGGGEPGEDDGEQTQQEEPAEAEATDTESADAEAAQEEDGDTSGNAEDVTLDPADALQTYAYPIAHESGEVEGEITVGVHAVTVEGETMQLQLSFTPDYEEPEDGPVQFNALHARGQNLGNAQWLRPIIADRENLNSHHVLQWDAGAHNNYWMTMLGYSGEGLFAPAGEAVPFFAYFAAPQDPIDQVDVSLPEIGVTFESVELIGDLQAGDGEDEA